MVLRTSFAILISLGLSRVSTAPPDGVHRVTALSVVVVLDPPPQRRLRGDWEPPGLLVMAHNEDWALSAAAILRAAGKDTDLAIVTRSGDSITLIAEWLAEEDLLSPRVRFLDAGLDSPWVRDFGPLEVVDLDGEPTWLDPIYDASRPIDDALPGVLGNSQRVRVEQIPFYIDGGAVVSNGGGLCVMTTTSVESAGVDLDTRSEVSSLQGALGCQVLAVVPALVGERTSHADMSVQFVSPTRAVVAQVAVDQWPINAGLLDQTADAIREAGRQLGMTIDIDRVHMPVSDDGETFFTYVNGIRLAGGFVVPSYERVDEGDQKRAFAELRAALGDVPLVPIPADRMIELAGAIHCITLGLSGRAAPAEASRALR